MMARCISEVPEKIRDGTASRSSASTPVSVTAPDPPKIWTASSPDWTAASEIHSLHIAMASSQRWPDRCSSPARYSSSRPASSRTFMSTSRFETDWKAPISCPNWTRPRACSTHRSRVRCMAPT